MKLSQNNEELFMNILPGDITIDCGANIGHVTQKMAERGATVFAFEPNPYAYEILRMRFALYPNVICSNKGVWDKEGKMLLYHYVESHKDPVGFSYASSIFQSYIVDPNNYAEIEVIDLTEFIKGLGKRVKLLKMDIEGAEFELIEKIIVSDLYTVIDHIVAETHEWLIPNSEPKLERIKELIQAKQIRNIDLNWN